PRFTSTPSSISCDALRAISSRVQAMSCLPFAYGAPLYPFFVLVTADDSLHVDARRMDMLRFEFADFCHDFYLGDGDFSGGSHHGIEVLRGPPVLEVAQAVPAPRLDQGKIRLQPCLKQILLAVKDPGLPSFGNRRAYSGRSVEAGYSSSPRPDPLRKSTLGYQFHLKFTRQILPLELLVLADVRGDHLFYLAVFQQKSQTPVIDPAVVRDDSQILHPGFA